MGCSPLVRELPLAAMLVKEYIDIAPFTPSDTARDATGKWIPYPFSKR